MEYVNLQQAEYDEMQMKLEALHLELLMAEQSIREQIGLLASMEGGFYVEAIAGKIQSLMNEMKLGPVTRLKEAFVGTEEALMVFIQAVIETDTCA